MKRLIFSLLFSFYCALASAGQPTLQAFDKDSLASIQAAYAGQPFVLVLWSVDCQYCVKELASWGRLQKQYPSVSIVLVNADVPAAQHAARELIKKKKLEKLQNWAFADVYAEPIRWSIDPKWRGELPRLYRYDAQHRMTVDSGLPSSDILNAWFREMIKARP